MAIQAFPWCALLQHEGKSPFMFGTVVLPMGTPQEEVERTLFDLYDQTFPTRPRLLKVERGSLIFMREGEI